MGNRWYFTANSTCDNGGHTGEKIMRNVDAPARASSFAVYCPRNRCAALGNKLLKKSGIALSLSRERERGGFTQNSLNRNEGQSAVNRQRTTHRRIGRSMGRKPAAIYERAILSERDDPAKATVFLFFSRRSR